MVLDGADPAVLRGVLTRACGRVTDQGAAPRQACLKDLWQASGWSACLRKDHRHTQRVLGAPDVRLTYVSRSLAQMVRELHQEGQQTPTKRPADRSPPGAPLRRSWSLSGTGSRRIRA